MGLSPFTDEEYTEAMLENFRVENAKARRELKETNVASMQSSNRVRVGVAHRVWEMEDIFRKLTQSKRVAENSAELLRKMVEGPS